MADNLSIEQLTPSQRRDFERAIVDGRLSSSLTAWEPWWRRGSKAEGEQAEVLSGCSETAVVSLLC